jgi:hypothetical protein
MDRETEDVRKKRKMKSKRKRKKKQRRGMAQFAILHSTHCRNIATLESFQ